jgi:hypothetical protein
MSIHLVQLGKKNTAAAIIAQGGILTAVTVLLTTLGNVLSLVEILQYLALTPIIIACVMRGPAFAIQVSTASTLLVGIIWGFFPGGLFFFLSTVPLAVTLGYLFQKRRSSRKILLVTIVLLFVSLFLILWLSIKLFGVDINRDIQGFARTFKVSTPALARWFVLLSPTFMFLTALCYAFYIWLFNTFLLDRMKLVERKRHFLIDIYEFFDLPRYLVMVWAACVVIMAGNVWLKNEPLLIMAINLAAILSLVFYFRGIFSIRARMGKIARLALFIFTITIGVPAMILAGLYATALGSQRIPSAGNL